VRGDGYPEYDRYVSLFLFFNHCPVLRLFDHLPASGQQQWYRTSPMTKHDSVFREALPLASLGTTPLNETEDEDGQRWRRI
jgi:hypothetical protein